MTGQRFLTIDHLMSMPGGAGLCCLLGAPYGAPCNPITRATLRLDPDFDKLHADPEFQKAGP
ncbi:MAG TPA: hypothetical protein VIE67_09810 [Rudaea sp.]|jgi:hypothetical protein|uniref:hypothetical protein n=1 Tax=Rudaea sp. TaxID=2136325 RepID=UPI002F9249B9